MLQSLKVPLIKEKGNSKHCLAYYSKASMRANKTGSIYLQVMCTAHPAENLNYVFKGRQGAPAALAQCGREMARGGNAKQPLQSGLPAFSVALGRERAPERSCDVHSAGRERPFLLFR